MHCKCSVPESSSHNPTRPREEILMSLIATTHALWEENFTRPKNKNDIYIYIYIIHLFTTSIEEDLNLNCLPIEA